jgi:hypothetical protein
VIEIEIERGLRSGFRAKDKNVTTGDAETAAG